MISVRGVPTKLDPALAGILNDLRRSVVALNEAATKSSTPTTLQRAATNLSGQTPTASTSGTSGSTVSVADVVAAVLANSQIQQVLSLANLVGTDEGLEGSINKLTETTAAGFVDAQQQIDTLTASVASLTSALAGKQPLDDGLTEISGLTKADGAVIIGDGTAWTEESDATLRAHIGLEIGADVQAHSVSLDNLAAGYSGWGAPTGTLSRTALAVYAGQTVSATYTQAEVQGIDDTLKQVSRTLAALITDLQSAGVLKT